MQRYEFTERLGRRVAGVERSEPPEIRFWGLTSFAPATHRAMMTRGKF